MSEGGKKPSGFLVCLCAGAIGGGVGGTIGPLLVWNPCGLSLLFGVLGVMLGVPLGLAFAILSELFVCRMSDQDAAYRIRASFAAGAFFVSAGLVGWTTIYLLISHL